MNTPISMDEINDIPEYAKFYAVPTSPELQKTLQEIEQRKLAIDAFRPVQGIEHKWNAVHTKLRNEWTHHTNALEGSTLSLGDTIFFLQYGLTIEGKPLKDFLDVRNHTEAIELLYEFIGQNRPLSESFIKEINALLLYGVKSTPALDQFGQRTQKTAHPGRYKLDSNSVLQLDGTMHYYVEPEQVPAQMAFLVNWIQQSNNVHPIVKAALAHYNMVRIHPFDDGNGRGARLLMNCLLIQAGYPPAIIRSEERRKYIQAINQADQGELAPFVQYIGQSLLQTEDTVLAILEE